MTTENNGGGDPGTAESAPQVDSTGPALPTRGFGAYRRFWVTCLLAFAADQVTKEWIAARLPYPTYGQPGSIVVVSEFFNIVHVGNTGAAWSLFSGRSLMLSLLALATLLAIYFWRRALALQVRTVQIAFGLLCGGIVGNLVDRIRHGHVIDFLDFHFGSFIYPTFNVADSCICVGVGLYLIWSMRNDPTKTVPTESSGPDA
jgi:signal peptidase II